jgi:prepilin-type N-terminal cleavage/methylation domain-containing protein
VGFTLVELVVVIVVLGVLVGMIAPNIATTSTPALRSQTASDLGRLQSAMYEGYQMSGQYPASTAGWSNTVIASPVFQVGGTNLYYRITTDVGGQGATIDTKFDNGTVQASCTMNLGTRASPGVMTC